MYHVLPSCSNFQKCEISTPHEMHFKLIFEIRGAILTFVGIVLQTFQWYNYCSDTPVVTQCVSTDYILFRVSSDILIKPTVLLERDFTIPVQVQQNKNPKVN